MSDHYVDPENVQISGRLSDKRKLSEMEENSVQLKRKLIKMEKDSSQLQYKLSEMEEEEEKLYKQQVSMAGCQSIGLFEFIGLQSKDFNAFFDLEKKEKIKIKDKIRLYQKNYKYIQKQINAMRNELKKMGFIV